MSTPTKAAEIREALERIVRGRIPSHAINDYRKGWMDGMDEAKEEARRALSLLADLDGGGDAPPDPDAHITDQEQYLKAKQERANDVDFDGA